MKLFVVLIWLFLPLRLIAQQINGLVVDKLTNKPIPYATVTGANSILSTSSNGKFSLANMYPGDTIAIRCIGYKTAKIGYGVTTSRTLTIYLQPMSILLQDVIVKQKYDSRIDSIRTRREFAKVFVYKRPTFKDMFITVDPYLYVPNNYINATNSTASIVSVNLLSVMSLLSKNKDHTSKLQRTLLVNEESDYVDRAFSKQKITGITKLKGDSLLSFMDEYRPTAREAKKMSDYEMVLYIKKSYGEFIINYDPADHNLCTK